MSTTRVAPTERRTSLRHNNFDGLRLLGALLVVVGHAYVLSGRPEDVPRVLGEPVHHLGVVIFFSLSGYLVTSSWLRFGRVRPYLGARLLRLLPALVVVVLLTTFVLGPLLTTLSVGEYLTTPGTWTYLQNVVLLGRFDLPGVLVDVPVAGDVNGSLWTLAPEFGCYLLVPVLVPALVARRRVRVAVCLLLAAALAWLVLPRTPLATVSVWGGLLGDTATVARYFFVGAVLAVLGRHRPDRRLLSARLGLAALLALGLVAALLPAVQGPAALVLLPYAVVSLGVAVTPVVSSAGRFGDLSYGLYLWAFPVQQTLLHAVGRLPLWLDVLAVTGAAGALALVSWHLVEAPALRLKSRLRRAGA